MKDKTLHRDIIILSVVVFTFASVESIFIHLEYFPQFDNINGQNGNSNVTLKTALETYYLRSHGHWRKLMGYNPMLAVLAFVSHKFVVMCWNYVDLILIIFARALNFKFKGLCLVAEENLNVYKEAREIRPFSLAG